MSLTDLTAMAGSVARRYAAGEKIFEVNAGSEDGVCLVLKGYVDATSQTAPGDGTSVARYEPGSFFGLSAISVPRFETAVAGEDGTTVLFLGDADFRKFLRQDANFLAKLFKSTLARLRAIQPAQLRKPGQAIDLDALFGSNASKVFAAVRQRNLKIPDHLNKMRNKFVSPGDHLFAADEERDNLIYLLVEGEVVQYWTRDGAEEEVIRLQPGALFGFLKSSDGRGHVLTAKAGKGTAKLIGLDEDILNRLGHLDADLSYSIYQNMILTVGIIEREMLR